MIPIRLISALHLFKTAHSELSMILAMQAVSADMDAAESQCSTAPSPDGGFAQECEVDAHPVHLLVDAQAAYAAPRSSHPCSADPPLPLPAGRSRHPVNRECWSCFALWRPCGARFRFGPKVGGRVSVSARRFRSGPRPVREAVLRMRVRTPGRSDCRTPGFGVNRQPRRRKDNVHDHYQLFCD